jgi:hypothetical protein
MESVYCSTLHPAGVRPLSRFVLVDGARGVVALGLRPVRVFVSVSPMPVGNRSRLATAR